MPPTGSSAPTRAACAAGSISGASLVGRPLVLIMDEPSTGLDPRSRLELWGLIEDLVNDGTTLLLTTQYLEEADRLAHRVAVIERGGVIAEGTPDELKQRIGGDVLEVSVTMPGDVDRLVSILRGLGSSAPVADVRGQRVTLPTTDRVQTLLAAARRIEDAASSSPTSPSGGRRSTSLPHADRRAERQRRRQCRRITIAGRGRCARRARSIRVPAGDGMSGAPLIIRPRAGGLRTFVPDTSC